MGMSEGQKKALAYLKKESEIEPLSKMIPLKVLSTGSLVLDALTGCNGFPMGRIIELSGEESSGKSTFAMAICGIAQKAGYIPVYIDVEQTFDILYAKKLGFDPGDDANPKGLIFQPRTIEEATEIADQFCALPETGVLVLDSVASARPEEELDGSDRIGQHAKAVGDFVNRISKRLVASGCMVLGVNQKRVKMEKVGQRTVVSETVTGGWSWRYACTCRFELKIVGGEMGVEFNPLTGKEEPARISNRIRVTNRKNKAGSPHRSGEIVLRFGEGIDNLATVIELAEAYRVVEKSGNGYFKYEPKKKKPGVEAFTCRGAAELRKLLMENEKLRAEIIAGIGLDRVLKEQEATGGKIVVGVPVATETPDGELVEPEVTG